MIAARHHPGARRSGRGDDGIAVVLVALILIPLVLFAAIGVDISSWHARLTELQKAADAAASAGSVWMPNLDKASQVAAESLAHNGIVHGVDDIVVEITEGGTPTSLRVVVTDTNAKRYLSQMVGGEQVLTRFAEAEYFLPLPLGSPLDYFGGVRAKAERPITWPFPYDSEGRTPVGTTTCNVGTSSGQGLGRWVSGVTYSTGFTSSAPQCRWTVATTTTPLDPTTQPPGNVPCNDVQSSPTTMGRWSAAAADTDPPVHDSQARHTSGTGDRQCSWALHETEPADFATRAPANAPCNVTGQLAFGRWDAGGYVPLSLHREATAVLCQWTANLTPGTNPIAADRNPRFWGQIHGPGGNQVSGDAYATKCVTATNCSTPDNDLYVDPSNANQGYWYVVKIPEGGGGSTEIRVYDASLNPQDGLNNGPGDSNIVSGTMSFSTTYRVYRQTNPLDFNARTPVTPGDADKNPNSCSWRLQKGGIFRWSWVDLCTLTTQPGETYLLNVRSETVSGFSNSAGRNSYAIEAVTDGGVGPQPALHAYNKMVMYNNIDGGVATFYVAEVSPEYAGKTLVLELFDAGESSGQSWLYPMLPSASEPGAVVHATQSSCAFDSTRDGYPRSSDLGNGGVCSVRASDDGALYNGHWLTIRATIPADYTCTPGLDPTVDPGSCWWGIQYDFGGAANDTTTWQARVEGNPVHLTG